MILLDNLSFEIHKNKNECQLVGIFLVALMIGTSVADKKNSGVKGGQGIKKI